MGKLMTWILAGLAGFSLATAAQSGSSTAGAGTASAPGTNTATTATPLSDGQIASVLQEANKAEAAAGKLASKKAANPDVKKYAQQMVIDHTRAKSDTEKVFKQLKAKPQEFTTANDLKTAGEQEHSRLQQLSGADFDKAYVDGQISMHQEVLKTIDTQLLPSAQSAEVKALLQKIRPKIEAHLRHAESLKTKLM